MRENAKEGTAFVFGFLILSPRPALNRGVVAQSLALGAGTSRALAYLSKQNAPIRPPFTLKSARVCVVVLQIASPEYYDCADVRL